MKTTIRSIVLALLCLHLQQAYAQPCNVTNPTITNVHNTDDGQGKGVLTFDLDFTIGNNGGSKIIVIHLWPASLYPNLPYANATDAAELNNSYGTIVINNEIKTGHPNATYYSSYPFSAGVNLLATDPLIVRSGGATQSDPFQFHLTEITIPNMPSSGVISLKGDIWATNSGSLNSNTSIQCVTKNINLVLGDPILTQPLKNCSNPRTLSFYVGATSATPISVDYRIYQDDKELVSGQPIFNPSSDVDVTIGGAQTISVASDAYYDGANTAFIGNGAPGENSSYWVVVTYTPPGGGSSFSIAKIATNTCAGPLPVSLKSFTVARNNANVLLKWETTKESNNSGFVIERKTGMDAWRDLSFVSSRSDNGASGELLAYQYNDANSYKGITQYRLRQVDIDGRTRYSDIKAVKGLGQILATVSVFPNPAQGGNFTVLFNDDETYDLQIVDANGRVVKQFTSVRVSKSISDLKPGQYLVIADNQQTQERRTTKVVSH